MFRRDTVGGQLLDDVARVGHGSGQSVQLGDHECVSGAARGERLAKAGAVSVGSGQAVVDVDPLRFDAEGGEGITLRGEVLTAG